MSSIQQITNVAAAYRLASTRPERDIRAGDGIRPGDVDLDRRSGLASNRELPTDQRIEETPDGAEISAEMRSLPEESWAKKSVRSVHYQAWLDEWAERVNDADLPSSLLIQRPAPDMFRPHNPTAMEAYREVSRLVEKLNAVPIDQAASASD